MKHMPWAKEIELMIVGAEKAGTTALLRHLEQLSIFSTHRHEEMIFFTDNCYEQGEEFAKDKYFPDCDDRIIVAKDVRLLGSVEGQQRLKKSCPNVKIVVILREPASRAYSAYTHAVAKGREKARTFEKALGLDDYLDAELGTDLKDNVYVRGSTYSEKIKSLHTIFGIENVLAFYQDEYRASPVEGVRSILKLLRYKDELDCSVINFGDHNRAAQAKSLIFATFIRRILRSRGKLKQVVRKTIPHTWAHKIRSSIEKMNLSEKKNYGAIKYETSDAIRKCLMSDATELVRLVGHCPWKN